MTAQCNLGGGSGQGGIECFDLVVGATFTGSALEAPLTATLQARKSKRSTRFIAARDLLPFLMSGSLASAATLLVMLRPSDLIDVSALDGADVDRQLTENLQVYVDALARFQTRTGAHCWLLLVPAPQPPESRAALLYSRACDALALPANVRTLDWQAFIAQAGTGRIFDPIADKLGHVPFTTDCLNTLARYILAQLGEPLNAGAARTTDASAPPVAAVAAATTAASQGDAFARFLSRLQLRVVCRSISAADSGFAARLAHTAATFHASGRKLTEAHIDALMNDADVSVLAIDVTDRFGAYGPSGFVVVRRGVEPVVEEFVLSCVVLGKQVEHVVLLALARAAQSAGVTALPLHCVERDGSQVAVWLRDLGSGARARCPSMLSMLPGEMRFEPGALGDAIVASAPGPEAVQQIVVALPPGLFGGAV